MGIKDRVSDGYPAGGIVSCSMTGVGQGQKANVLKKFVVRALILPFGKF